MVRFQDDIDMVRLSKYWRSPESYKQASGQEQPEPEKYESTAHRMLNLQRARTQYNESPTLARMFERQSLRVINDEPTFTIIR